MTEYIRLRSNGRWHIEARKDGLVTVMRCGIRARYKRAEIHRGDRPRNACSKCSPPARSRCMFMRDLLTAKVKREILDGQLFIDGCKPKMRERCKRNAADDGWRCWQHRK